MSSNKLQHGITADVPDDQSGQPGGGRDNVAEPKWIHSEKRGSRQLQMFQ